MAVPYTIYPSLRDKVILLTGAAEGIGAAAVELFCHQGSKVIFLDISETSANALIEKLKKAAATATSAPYMPSISIPIFFYCNVTDLGRLKSVANEVLEKYGTVDVLVNNTGAAGPQTRVPSADVTPESWELDINVNLRHQFFLTQAVVPAMQRQGKGSIINMGSITWSIPTVGVPVYAIAKAAIMGMTKTHSKEYGKDGVRANSIMPGAIATERQIRDVLTPEYRAEVMAAQSLKRDLIPEEVARVILFLASDDSSAITGSSYVVDGGWVSDP